MHHYREDFPMLKQLMNGKPLIYLDSAVTAQKPQQVIDAIDHYYSSYCGSIHRSIYALSQQATDAYEATRIKVKQLLNAEKTEEIIFTRGTTEAINLVAACFGQAFIEKGDQIIISEMEHHSNIVPWQMLCERTGALLKVIPMDDLAVLDLAEFTKLLATPTKLVALGHISNATGTINPIKKMIEMAHQAGAKVLIDGAQAIPHLKVDVRELDADFYVFSGHKAYGPTGVGVLYGKEELLNAMPPYQGGGDMIETVTFEKTTYNHLPLKFEAGTPMIAEVIGLGSAIDYMNAIGLKKIYGHTHQLLEYATKQLELIPGLKIIGTAPEKGAIITFVIDKVHPLDLATLLDLEGIAVRSGHLCAQPTMRHFSISSACRISFALYNTKEEVDHFIKTTKILINKLC